MYDLRYHILTIVGIFLALVIGLVLGVALGRSNAADVTTDTLVSTLRESFDALQDENDALAARADASDALSEDMLQAWSSGRLAGQRVLVLAGGDVQAEQAACRALMQAGADTATVRLRVPQDASALADAVADADVLDGVSQDASELAEAVGTALADEWARAASAAQEGEDAVWDACPLTRALRQAGALVLDDPLAQVVACTCVVDVAHADEAAEPLSLAVAGTYAKAGFASVAAQVGSANPGLVSVAWGRGVSGTGGVETTSGRFSLVWLLSGAMPGAYGVDGHDPWPSRVRSQAQSAASSADASASSAQEG